MISHWLTHQNVEDKLPILYYNELQRIEKSMKTTLLCTDQCFSVVDGIGRMMVKENARTPLRFFKLYVLNLCLLLALEAS